MVHSTTKQTITKYKELAKDHNMKEIWKRAFGKELGGLAQGDKKIGTAGINTIFFLTRDNITNIPRDQTVTYARIVVAERPQKPDQNRVRITVEGNLLDYPGELTTNTADLTTIKLLWNIVVSTRGAKYMTIDIKNFYLNTPLDRYEYMCMPLDTIPTHIQEQYGLANKATHGYVYMEIQTGIPHLPQAGVLANKLLRKCLVAHGYYEVIRGKQGWKSVLWDQPKVELC